MKNRLTMKSIITILIAGIFLNLSALAQDFTVTVHGNVWQTSANTIIPVPNQEVIITIDSSANGFNYQNTVYTDQEGYYEDVVTIPDFSGFEYVQTQTFDSCMNQYQYQGQPIIPGTTLQPMDYYICSNYPPDCQALFSYFPMDPGNGFTYSFVNQSTGNISQFYWDFGDSTYSSEENPVHAFPGPGLFNVCLTISCDSGITTTIYCDFVSVGGNNSGCENYFTYTFTDGLFTVNFEGYMLTDIPPQSYWWDFGDGTTGVGQSVTHTYNPSPGTIGMYIVGLTTVVIDSIYDSCFYTSYQEVWLQNNPPGCSAYYSYQQDDSLTFTFDGYIYTNNDTVYPANAEYLWDFGDGTTGTGQTTTHTFQENPAGGYSVCLTTTAFLPDSSVCSAMYCDYVSVEVPSFFVFGTVILGDNLLADQATVHLMTLDTLWQGVIELQSTTIDSMGQYYFSDIPMYNSRMYFVQAELSESSAWYGEYVPTYHLNSLTWEEAFPILPLMNGPADIWMIPAGQTDSGDGSISGVVTDLGTRGFLDNIEIVLLDENKNPLAYSRSDSEGNFAFEGLPMGTYIIHAEILGIHTVESPVTLSTDQPGASVEIQVSGGEANIVFGVRDLHITLDEVGDVYPNPANAEIRLDITTNEPANITITIYSQTGQVALEKEIFTGSGLNNLKLESGDLTPGIYMLRLTTDQGEIVARKFMKIR